MDLHCQPPSDNESAAKWASCFRALGEPVRIRILHALAAADRPLTVGEITEAAGVGQSTVSHHLAKLADVDFVDVEHVANRSLWRLNPACISGVPTAAHIIFGARPPAATTPPSAHDNGAPT